MENMEEIYEEQQKAMRKLGELTPDEQGQFKSWVDTLKEEGPLGLKQSELISVALSVLSKCKWCITIHVKRALEYGATKDEIMNAAWLAVMMGGGPALMYTQLVIQSLEDFEE